MDRSWRRDWVVAAVVVWALTTLVVAVQAYLQPLQHTMFDIYAVAARCWWSGEDMYAFRREWYRYSPLFAIVMSPLAALPDGLGNALWKTLNGAVFVAGVWAWLRQVLPVAPTRTVAGASLLLALPGSMHSLHIGQANLTMTGLSLLGLAAVARGRWTFGAALIAAATLIKGYPLALAMILSVIYLRSFSWRYAAAMAVGLIVPFAFQSLDSASGQYQSWFHHLTASGAELNRERQRALDNLLDICGHPIAPRQFVLLAVAAGAGVFGLCVLHARQTSDRRDRLARMSILYSLWVVLFGPATESCTYAVVAPVAAWLVADAFGRRAGWFACGVATVGLILSGPAATDLFGSGVRKFTNAHGLQQIGGLLLLGYVLVRTAHPLRPLTLVVKRPRLLPFGPPIVDHASTKAA